MNLRFVKAPRYFFETPPGEAAGGGAPPGGERVLGESAPAGGVASPVAAPADPSPAVGAWPEDWRGRLAGEDEGVRNRLDRFQSPEDVWKSYQSLEKKLSSGELKAGPPNEDAAPEEVSAWREANGIPKEPKDYYEAMEGNLNVGEVDRPRADSFLEEMHALNAPPELVAKAIDWSYRQQEADEAAMLQADEVLAYDTTETLRTEWGADYAHNINRVHNFLDTAPAPTAEGEAGVKDRLLNARYEGKPIMSDPDVIRWLVSKSRELNPTPTLVPAGKIDDMSYMDDRITEINQMMRTDRAAYNRDEKVQAEYRDLVEQRATLESRTRR